MSQQSTACLRFVWRTKKPRIPLNVHVCLEHYGRDCRSSRGSSATCETFQAVALEFGLASSVYIGWRNFVPISIPAGFRAVLWIKLLEMSDSPLSLKYVLSAG